MKAQLVMRWRSLLSRFGYGYAGKSVKVKNPRRVEGGRKAAITRKRNKEAREFAAVAVEIVGNSAKNADAGRSTGCAG